MAKTEDTLVKAPYRNTPFTDYQLEEFVKCADPDHGPEYFMSNYFHIQHPVKGKMLYYPYDYQKRLIDTYHNYRFSISMMPRQTGKSTSAAGYLLWVAMFVPDSTILIAAHKYTGSQEIMQRIRYAYELCPDYIRAGATNYNRGSIDFENGSRIISTTTTENTGRGMSISLLYADEFAFVRPGIAKEFWTSISPTLATGGKAIITSTPNSDEDQFALLWKGANKREDAFGNQTSVGINGFKPFRSYWNEHPDRDEKWAAEQQAQLGEDRFRREMGCLTHDTLLTCKDPTGKILKLTISELYDLFAKMTQTLHENNLGLQVLTDTGWSEFEGVLNKGTKPTALLQLTNTSIKATLDHKIYTDKFDMIPVSQLRVGTQIHTSSGLQRVVSVTLANEEQVYDLLNVKNNRRFYANDILVSNCEFIINDETLIAPAKLIDLSGHEPLYRTGQVRWYQKPRADRTYVISLDPSLGTGGDPSAIQIFAANTTEQVGEWRHNRTPIPEQIRILADICRHINETVQSPENIYYSIENNTIGEAALISIAEYGEENIQGYFLSEPANGNGRRYRKGFNTTNKHKLSACNKLKSLIESGKMKIRSSSLISELKTFVAHGISYAAKPGETDDLVMATVLNIRMLQLLQTYNNDIDNQMRDHGDAIIAPMPFISVMR